MDLISLWYCEGASDKTYQAEIVPVSVQIHSLGRKYAAC
jgi:hypothetical protein